MSLRKMRGPSRRALPFERDDDHKEDWKEGKGAGRRKGGREGPGKQHATPKPMIRAFHKVCGAAGISAAPAQLELLRTRESI
jgi:hypothetical protein